MSVAIWSARLTASPETVLSTSARWLRVGGQVEGEQRLLLAGQRCHEGGALLRVERRRRQRRVADRLLLGDGRPWPGRRRRPRARVVRQATRRRALAQAVAVRDQVGDDHAVPEHHLGDRHAAGGRAPPGGCASMVSQLLVDPVQPVPHGGRHVAEPSGSARYGLIRRRCVCGPAGCTRPARCCGRPGRRRRPSARPAESWVSDGDVDGERGQCRTWVASIAPSPTATRRTVASAITPRPGRPGSGPAWTGSAHHAAGAAVAAQADRCRRVAGRVVGPVLTTSPPSFLPRLTRRAVPGGGRTRHARHGRDFIRDDPVWEAAVGRKRSDGASRDPVNYYLISACP